MKFRLILLMTLCLVFVGMSSGYAADFPMKLAGINIYGHIGGNMQNDTYASTGAEVPSGTAFGATVQPKFTINKYLKLVAEWSYTRFNIDEPEESIDDHFEWLSWFKYKENIAVGEGYGFDVDWQWRTRTNQNAGLLMLELGPGTEGPFRPYVNIGGGGHIYIRKGWIHSEWNATWPNGQVDHAVERSHSDRKLRGVIWTVVGGGGVDIMLSDRFGLSAVAQYHSVVKGHHNYRWDGWWKLNGGFAFYY
jgi:hypothetical protein